jgi:uncharacterized protein YndB with AHSA1/START domain
MSFIKSSIEIAAPAAQVWAAWTTDEGVRSFFAPDSRIVAAPGGAYELYFMLDAPEGLRGSEGCVVLEVDEPERLAFTWNFPPTLPSIRDQRTRVDVTIEALDDRRSELTIAHTGWQDGEDWDQGFAYFERAWSMVLARLAYRFLSGPVDWEDPYTPEFD